MQIDQVTSTETIPPCLVEQKEDGLDTVIKSDLTRSQPLATDQKLKGSRNPVQTIILKASVMIVKSWYPKYGRTRIRKELYEGIKGSEKTIGRVLKELGIQNKPKRIGGPVKLTLTLPEEVNTPKGSVILKESGNVKIIVPLIYRETMGNKIKKQVSEGTTETIEQYTFGLLDNKCINQAAESVPLEVTRFLYNEKATSPKKIRKSLFELGTKYEELVKLFLPKEPPKALAIDEKVVEKWLKEEITEVISDNPSLGIHFVSRRGKILPAVSIEVVAAIDKKGCAKPIYFGATPAPHLNREEEEQPPERLAGGLRGKKDTQSEPSSPVQQAHQQQIPVRSKHKLQKKHSSKKGTPTSSSKGKRAKLVIKLLQVVMILVGQVPLRMDNGYGQIAVIKWLNQKSWLFIVHGRSNLVLARSVKSYMKNHCLKYYKEKKFDKRYGGWITVIGYCKRGKIYIYLTNENGSAQEILSRYRARWRIENLFKWCPCFSLLPGTDPFVHAGLQFVILFFMSNLVRQFHASLPTIERILSYPSESILHDSHLSITFSRLPSRYFYILHNFVISLPAHWKAKLERSPL